MPELEVYVTLRSPYSYLASPRIREIARTLPIEVVLRPVYPIAIRIPDFFEKADPMWLAYFQRDVPRVAEMLGVAYAAPDPDPIVQDMETARIAVDQPHIWRLTRLTQAACEMGGGLAFYAGAARAVFGAEGSWAAPGRLEAAAAEAGLDWAALAARVEADPEGLDRQIAQNAEAQRRSGHWGTPLLVFEGEPFFGQDRVEMCLWRMRQKGVSA
ncbi:MAG: DsbA family protein [Pseudomonadota bacterium]